MKLRKRPFFFLSFFLFTFRNCWNLFGVYQNGIFFPGESIFHAGNKSEKVTLPPLKNIPITPLLDPTRDYAPGPIRALKWAPGPHAVRLACVAGFEVLQFAQGLLNQWGIQPSLTHGHPPAKLRHCPVYMKVFEKKLCIPSYTISLITIISYLQIS